MPLYRLTEEEKKSYAKKYLENLEYWLRRVIDQKLEENMELIILIMKQVLVNL